MRRVFSATFWLGNFAALCTRQIHTPQKFAQFATATLFGAAIITAIILAINWLFLQVIVPSVVNLISLFFKIGIIVLLFNAVLRLMSTDNNLLYSVEPNKLLAQIPRTKCGHLILLTVMDHYVEVTTARGKHMI